MIFMDKTTSYIGRWDRRPADWPGNGTELRGLYETDEKTIKEEVARQKAMMPKPANADPMDSYHFPGALIGEYTLQEFEETFNNDLDESLNTKDYFIKIF